MKGKEKKRKEKGRVGFMIWNNIYLFMHAIDRVISTVLIVNWGPSRPK